MKIAAEGMLASDEAAPEAGEDEAGAHDTKPRAELRPAATRTKKPRA